MKLNFSKPFVALIFLALLVACGEDSTDNSGENIDNRNDNRNISVAQSETARLEFPKTKGGNSIVVVHSTTTDGVNYSIEWDCDKKAQRWTCYQMYAANSKSNGSRKGWWGDNDPFKEDEEIPEDCRTTLADYRGSGFDRGHICPSADRLCSKDANEQTFLLSNMHPQWNKFNAGVWKKMEDQVRKWNTSTFRDTLFVCKGGTIDTADGIKQYTTSGLIVPRYFFMAVLCKKDNIYKAIALWVEHLNENHKNDDLQQYAVSIDELEKMTGIDFFCNLPDVTENSVEKAFSTASWTW